MAEDRLFALRNPPIVLDSPARPDPHVAIDPPSGRIAVIVRVIEDRDVSVIVSTCDRQAKDMRASQEMKGSDFFTAKRFRDTRTSQPKHVRLATFACGHEPLAERILRCRAQGKLATLRPSRTLKAPC